MRSLGRRTMRYGITRKTWTAAASRPSVNGRHYLLNALLKRVSRAFYLSMRVLPAPMREPIGVAYLLARVADTIADTASMPVEERLAHLNQFRRIVSGEAELDEAAELSCSLTCLQSTHGERELIASLYGVFLLLNGLHEDDVERIRAVVLTLTDGMLFDLTTFPSEDSCQLTPLRTPEYLDEYCYLVAGCVGKFWTSMSTAHTPSLANWDEEEMRLLGVRFGLALQMTNILRDVPRDLRMGRCYIPQSELDRAGLCAEDLLQPVNARRARPLLAWGIRRTLDHFSAAEQYIIAIPRRSLRLRLAALWPLLIGLETLAKLSRSEDWLNPETRIKIPRSSVYGIIVLSMLCGRSNTLTKLWIRRIRHRIERTL